MIILLLLVLLVFCDCKFQNKQTNQSLIAKKKINVTQYDIKTVMKCEAGREYLEKLIERFDVGINETENSLYFQDGVICFVDKVEVDVRSGFVSQSFFVQMHLKFVYIHDGLGNVSQYSAVIEQRNK